MSKFNIPIEVEDNLETFLKLLPLSIRNKYMGNMASAMIKQNEKQIIENISAITQDILQMAISRKDEAIMQEELDKALVKLGVIIPDEKKKIKGKKSSPEEFVKKDSIIQEIESTVFTADVSKDIDQFESNDKIKENVNTNKDMNIEDQDIPKIQQKVDVKNLDLEEMFNTPNKD